MVHSIFSQQNPHLDAAQNQPIELELLRYASEQTKDRDDEDEVKGKLLGVRRTHKKRDGKVSGFIAEKMTSVPLNHEMNP